MAQPHVAGWTRLASRRMRSRWTHALGEFRQWSRGSNAPPERVLVVLGCQRSGTTLMTRLFGGDPDAKIYSEHSHLSVGDSVERLRLPAFPELARRIEASRFPLVVLKPLVESQHADRMLEALPRAHGLWMFRHWSDVACSNLSRFGRSNGIRNLGALIGREPNNWRAERVSEDVREELTRHYRESMGELDAAALFWWARNRLFFDLGLDGHARMLTCRYEELVADPRAVMAAIYTQIGRRPPELEVIREVTGDSVGRGLEAGFSPEVEKLCDVLWERLCRAHGEAPPCE
jgi:hypothetical protein